MKKKLLLAIAAIAFLGACNKEKLNLTTENQSSNIEIDFKYHESIKVFDKTGEYFVEYTIKSNNLEEFNVNKSMLENSYIDPGNSIPSSTYKKSAKTDTKAQPINDSQSLFVSVDNWDIGAYNNFHLISKDENRGVQIQSFTYWRFFTFEQADVYSVTVACNWNYATATDYIIDYASQGNPIGSHIVAQQSAFIPSGGSYAFPSIFGYARHRIQLTNPFPQSTCTLFIYF